MIALLAMLTVPPPPEPTTRTSGLPEYNAECLMVGRNGQAIKLSVGVRGQASIGVNLSGLAPRTIRFSSDADELRSLTDADFRPVSSLSNVGWRGRWETSDHAQAHIGTQPVSIKLISEDELARGVGIEVQERGQMTVPLYAGMCTAESATEAL